MNKSNRISRKAKHSVKAEVDRSRTLSSGDEEGASRGGNRSGRNPYKFLPVSFTEIQKGNERLFFIKNENESQSEESLSTDPQDYHLEIDNFSIIDVQDTCRRQDTITGKASRLSKACIPSSSAGHLSGEQLTLLQVLDNGQCLLETTTEQITFHSAEDDNNQSQASIPGQLQSVFRKKATQQRGQLTSQIEGDRHTRLKKVCQWSKRKVKNFLQCVQNHEQKFKKRNKKDFLIWNEIAKDMVALGHCDCNKDECFKKWSNLYRTWKIVSSRPKEGRRRWQIFDQITNIVKFMSQRGNNKSTQKSTEAKAKHSVKDLIKKMLEQNVKHQEAIRKKVEKFNAQVSRLDEERDELIGEIGKILQKV